MSAINQMKQKRQSRRRVQDLIWMSLGILITGLMLFPFYMVLNYSLMHQTDILNYPPPMFPPEISLEGYHRAWETLGEYLRSSLIYGFGTVLVTMLIAAPAAFALVKLRSRIGSIFLFCLILAQIAPSIIVANSLYALFTRTHLLNTYQAVILADSTIAVPFAIIIMRAFMLGIPPELAEAATVDGAGQLRIFWSIYVPLSRTAIITASLFSFLFGWGDFIFALILNSDPHHTPITVGLYRFVGSYSVEWPAVMATALVAAIPAILLLAVAQRYVAGGITAGAIKE
jgi:multiple sugar transport system permease protein